jgi:RNA polymerase sigma-70 factor (ECF subfamily)
VKPSAIPADVFEAARLGDQGAIARLLEITQPDIRRYARIACRTASDAEDAAQEALWRLFRHVGAIRTLIAFPAWLYTVVNRECRRLARKAGLMQPIGEDDEQLLGFDRPEAELRLDLAAAFEALPPNYRDVALLRDVQEMTIDEIAATLSLTRQAVKARLHRARQMTREFLMR